jgi:CBS-domain-containing membrane protein
MTVRQTARNLMHGARVVVPAGMSVRSAAEVLEAARLRAVPVVDSDGRCVGLFAAHHYRRWADQPADAAEVVSDWQLVAPGSDEVQDHMSRRFAAVTPDAGVPELLHRLRGAADPFLVVLDRQRRPKGVVCGMDVLAAEANGSRDSAGLVAAR